MKQIWVVLLTHITAEITHVHAPSLSIAHKQYEKCCKSFSKALVEEAGRGKVNATKQNNTHNRKYLM